jgi:uncharacterized protein YjbI with pentapeptide repeats
MIHMLIELQRQSDCTTRAAQKSSGSWLSSSSDRTRANLARAKMTRANLAQANLAR